MSMPFDPAKVHQHSLKAVMSRTHEDEPLSKTIEKMKNSSQSFMKKGDKLNEQSIDSGVASKDQANF